MRNPNSLNAKLYCWYYGISPYSLPKNLCPYVWKSIIAWLTVVPYFIYCFLFVLVSELFNKNYSNGDNTFKERFGMSTIMYIFLGMAFLLINAVIGVFFVNYDEKSVLFNLVGPGIMVWTVIILVGLYELVGWLIDKIKGVNREPNMLISFINAKIDKNCPRIDWDYSKLKNNDTE
jgi:hypothetical protein